MPGKANLYQETDIGWTKDGSMFVSDGYGNSRVAKFDKDGNFVKSWGERGNQPGEFNTPHSLVVDNNDVIYVADRGNSRIQTFDVDGNLKEVWRLPTAPWALCLTNGPNQVSTIADRSADSEPSRLMVRKPCPTLSRTRRRSSVRFRTIFSRPMTLSKKLRATKQAATDSSTTKAA